jgi:hypothetical protein
MLNDFSDINDNDIVITPIASQTCFNKFVNWIETFFQEFLGNSQVTEKEAWSLILTAGWPFSQTFDRSEWLVLIYPQDIMQWAQKAELESWLDMSGQWGMRLYYKMNTVPSNFGIIHLLQQSLTITCSNFVSLCHCTKV